MRKVLVAYFSASGVTKKVAEGIASAVNGDLFEIEPEVAYTSADLNWMDKKSRSSIEMNDKDFRPAMVKKELNLSQYESILLGFPIWWYVAPTIVNTFLESFDFSGKKIILFATSGAADSVLHFGSSSLLHRVHRLQKAESLTGQRLRIFRN